AVALAQPGHPDGLRHERSLLGDGCGCRSRPGSQIRAHWTSTVRSRLRAARPRDAGIPKSVRSMRVVAWAGDGPPDHSQLGTARVTGRVVPCTVSVPVRIWSSTSIWPDRKIMTGYLAGSRSRADSTLRSRWLLFVRKLAVSISA